MPYPPVQENGHVSRALSRLLEQFKEKGRISALVSSYVGRVQDLENALWEIILFRNIESGEGLILDYIGKLVGRGRAGLGDADYRIALRAQIRINRSSGTPEDVLAVTSLSLPDGFDFLYSETYPATILVEVLGAVDFVIDVLFDNLKRTKSGGVKLFLLWGAQDPDNAFTFAPGDSVVSSAQQGFADTGQSTGGFLVSVIGT